MKAITLLLAIFLSASALAIPQDFEALNFKNLSTGPEFNGIVALSNCSGAIFHFRGQSEDDQALMLTNGHCIGGYRYMRPGEVRVDQPANRRIRIFNREGRALRNSFRTDRLVYATMTNTDMAIYRLENTYRELREKYQINSLELSETKAAIDEPIVIRSGYHSYETSCLVEAIVPELREGAWTMVQSIRYSRECDVFGGTSGSPVTSELSDKIVGINNTGNMGRHDCSVNNPCEIDADGNKTVLPDRGYAQQAHWLYGCVDSDFRLNLQQKQCLLPR